MSWTNQNPFSGKVSQYGDLASIELSKKNLFDFTTTDRDQADAMFNTYLEALMREEDFQRSSPSAQVERLMAAGMSRAAALQAIQGSQYTEATPQMAGTVEQNKTARMEAAANIAFQSLGMLQSLSNSVPQFIGNVQQLKYNESFLQGNLQAVQSIARVRRNEATFSDWQLNAQNEQALFDNLLSSYKVAHPDFEQPNSLEDLIAFGSSLSPDTNDYTGHALKAWCDNSSDVLSKPLAYNTFKNSYDSQYASQYYNDVVRRKAFAGAALSEIDVYKAGAEIYEIGSRIYENVQNGNYSGEMLKVAQEQCDWYRAQVGLVNNQAKVAKEQARLLGIEADSAQLDYNYLEHLNPVRIAEAENQLHYLQSLRPEQFENEAKRVMRETDLGLVLADLMYARMVDAKQLYSSDMSVRTITAAQDLGLVPYIYTEKTAGGNLVQVTDRKQGYDWQHSNKAFDKLFNPNYDINGNYRFNYEPKFAPSSQDNMH